MRRKEIGYYTAMLAITLLMVFGHYSCSETVGQDSELTYHREGQLRNVMRNEILPIHDSFQMESTMLNSLIDSFVDAPDLNGLESVQSQWLKTMLSWQHCEMYNFGPIGMSFIHNSINKRPINISRIEGYLEGNHQIDKTYVNAFGSNAKGLSTLEYLIFNPEISNQDLLDEFNSINRRDYVKSLSELVNIETSTLSQLWQNYQKEFEDASVFGRNSSQDKLVNALISELEKIAIVKIAIPTGITGSGISPELIEAYYSQASLEVIQKNLSAIDRVFTGEFSKTAFRVGFDQYLEALGKQDLADDILLQIVKCQDQIKRIDIPLDQAITSKSDEINVLYTDMIELLTLVKVDMANAIGSTITFTDNDGD